MEVAESGSAGDAGQGCNRAGTLLTKLLQLSFLGVREADHRSVSPQHPHRFPELHFGDSSVNSQGLSTRPMAYVPRFARRLLSYVFVTTAPGSSEHCLLVSQPAQEFRLPKYSDRY